MDRRLHLGLGVLLFFLAGPAVRASQGDQDLRNYLKAFHKNPKKVMMQRLVKRDADTGRILPEQKRFPREAIESGEHIEERERIRKEIGCQIDKDFGKFCLKDYVPGKSPIHPEDTIEEFMTSTDHKIIKNLRSMEQLGLRKVFLPIVPWSGSYWPLAKGLIASRYADKGYPRSREWTINYSAFLGRSSLSMALGGAVNIMSPAEKYDYLMGDLNFSLTHAVWRKIQRYQEATGKPIPSWVGICHGWSPAAYTYEEPVRAVTVPAADGRQITFYPHDIKAIGTMLWSTIGGENVNFIGRKCAGKRPTRDSYGRVISDECGDTNPGTWHQVIVNQLGVLREAFIMDATYDAEVWNHPIYGYDMTFFNPQSLEPTHLWRNALVPVNEFTIDKFKRHRSPNTKYIIGIAMDTYYVVEVSPNHKEISQKNKKVAKYVYDLELDATFNIIGGEWYTAAHPDWLWKPRWKRGISVVDNKVLTETWDPSQGPVPADWRRLAPEAARVYSQPMAHVVEQLVKMSK